MLAETLHAAPAAPKFQLGQLVATPGALAELDRLGFTLFTLVRRHVCGDWSEMSADDQAENALSIEQGFRVFSAYTLDGVKFWVITEADRSATTVLLPSEY